MTSLFPPFDRRTSFRKQPFFYEAGRGVHTRGLGGLGQTLNLDFTSGVLDPRITFSRPSNATLYDSTGKLTYAPNNLTLQSEDFSSGSWTKAQATVSANSITAPNGTLTADTLLDTAVTNIHYAYQLITSYAPIGKTFIVSAYAKANTLNYATIGVTDISTGGNYAVAVFNLSDGTVSTSGAAGTGYAVSSPVITSVGDGWYRCSVVCTVGTSAPFLATAIGVNKTGVITGGAGGMESYLGNGSGIYIWGDQTEIVTYQTTPSTYITTTSAAYYGPRFDYNPTTLAANGLLIEEARTNLLTYSGALSSSWPGSNSTLTVNATTSPDGTVNASQLTRGANNSSESNLRQTTSQSVNTAYVFSVYAKAGSAGALVYVRDLAIDNTTATGVVTFALDGTNVITAGSTYTGKASIVAVGNGWYRCSITGTTPASIATNFIDLGCSTNVGQVTGSSGAYVYVYGAQLEAGAFATSYIPTAASSVARSADSASMTGSNFSSWYNQSEGTFVVRGNSPKSAFYGGFPICLDSSWGPYFDLSGFGVGTQSAGDADSPGPTPNNSDWATAAAFASTGTASATNGGAVGVGTNLPGVRLSLGIGARVNNTQYANGTIKSIQYYNKRLPNATLQSLTT